MSSVEAEISPSGRKIEVRFDYTHDRVSKAKAIPAGEFKRQGKDGLEDPRFIYHLDFQTCKTLRNAYGKELSVGPRLKLWAKEEKRRRQAMRSISQADTAELKVLPDVLPELYEAVHLGPLGLTLSGRDRQKALDGPASFQAADTAFMAHSPNALNANQPGTGKTIEAIASVFEAELDEGPNLVVAPVSSLEATWKFELEQWQPHEILVVTGSKRERKEQIEDALAMWYDGFPFWLVVNPDTLRLRAEYGEDSEGHRIEVRTWHEYEELTEIEWNTITLDEFHLMGLNNPNTLTARGLKQLITEHCRAMSGTPMGGKVLKLWGVLHHLHPDDFSSKWRFAEQWLEIEDHQYGYGKKIVDNLRKEVEDDFWEMLSTYMVRRTKEEVLPWLPPKQRVNLWVTMPTQQKEQYKKFAQDAEIRIEDEELTATGILAEYTRLKQFAFSKQKIEKTYDPETGNPILHPYPEDPSAKYPQILEILEERGITKKDIAGEEQVVIFSQSTRVVDWIVDKLKKDGIHAEKITGAIKAADRARLQKDFQSGKVRVMVMNTKAGGVSITLDRASTCIMIDETWNPDDQEQAEDRIHRGSRIHQVTIYYIRTKGTIEHYIQSVTGRKESVNFNILDARRAGLRATGVEE